MMNSGVLKWGWIERLVALDARRAFGSMVR